MSIFFPREERIDKSLPRVPGPDRELANADCTKQTWDLPANNAQELLAWLEISGMTVEQFKSLPVYKFNVDKLGWLQDFDMHAAVAVRPKSFDLLDTKIDTEFERLHPRGHHGRFRRKWEGVPFPSADAFGHDLGRMQEWLKKYYPNIEFDLVARTDSAGTEWPDVGDFDALYPAMRQFHRHANDYPWVVDSSGEEGGSDGFGYIGRDMLGLPDAAPMAHRLQTYNERGKTKRMHGFHINPERWADLDDLSQFVHAGSERGWFAGQDLTDEQTAEYLISHEFGHALSLALPLQNQQFLRTYNESGVGRVDMTWQGWRRRAKRDPVSLYATEFAQINRNDFLQEEERIAEAFASIYHNSPDKQSDYAKRMKVALDWIAHEDKWRKIVPTVDFDPDAVEEDRVTTEELERRLQMPEYDPEGTYTPTIQDFYAAHPEFALAEAHAEMTPVERAKLEAALTKNDRARRAAERRAAELQTEEGQRKLDEAVESVSRIEGETVEWKPVMTPAEAEAWAADSKVKEETWHTTIVRNVASIHEHGLLPPGHQARFQSDTERERMARRGWGAAWGEGVYVGLGSDPEAQEFYERMESTRLRTRVRLRNPHVFDYTGPWRDMFRDRLEDHPAYALWAELEDSGAKFTPQEKSDRDPAALTRELKRLGHDGLVVREEYFSPATGGDQVVVFDPKNVVVVESREGDEYVVTRPKWEEGLTQAEIETTRDAMAEWDAEKRRMMEAFQRAEPVDVVSAIASTVAWRPVMSPGEAEEWARGSAIPEETWHTTIGGNVASIHKLGLGGLPESAGWAGGWGSAWGAGVYVGLGEDPVAQDFYHRANVSKRLRTRVRLSNPYEFVDEGEHRDFDPETSSFADILSTPYPSESLWDELVARGAHFTRQERKDLDALALTREMKRLGYDGLIVREQEFTEMTGGNQVVIFDPKNVVVVDENQEDPEWLKTIRKMR